MRNVRCENWPVSWRLSWCNRNGHRVGTNVCGFSRPLSAAAAAQREWILMWHIERVAATPAIIGWYTLTAAAVRRAG